jgi:hypothetical protein
VYDVTTTESKPRSLRIRAFALGITVTELAEMVNTRRPLLSSMLSGAREADPAVMDKVEVALNAVERQRKAARRAAVPSGQEAA